MMKTRFALFSAAIALVGAAFGLYSTAAEAQSVSGSIYYGPAPAPAPVYVQPQVVYVEPQPVYVVPPTYYYPPAPAYYYAPPQVYYEQPGYWAPGISATFNFGGGKRGGHHGGHH